jgi:hypothetical protein
MKIYIYIYIFILLIVSILPTSAEEKYFATNLGEYDLGFTADYKVISKNCSGDETLGGNRFEQCVLFLDSNATEDQPIDTVIALTKYEKPDPANLDNKTTVMDALENQGCVRDKIVTSSRPINKKIGIAGRCKFNGDIYDAAARTIDDTASCSILTINNWENAKKLYNSIHIEHNKNIPKEAMNLETTITSIEPTTSKEIKEYIKNPKPEYFIGSVIISVKNTGSQTYNDVSLSIGGMGLILIDSNPKVYFGQSIKGALNSDYSLTWEIGNLLGSEKKELILTFVAWENFTTMGVSVSGFDDSGQIEIASLRHKPLRKTLDH